MKKIVAYGCSVTEGTELLDHEILNIPFEELRSWKLKEGIKWLDNTINGKTIRSILENHSNINKESSWAGQLAKHLNLSFENRAVAGSSISSTVLNIINDLADDKINANTIVLVGLPTPYRVSYFKDKKFIVQLPSDNTLKRKYKDFFWQEIFNDDTLMHNYFKDILFLMKLSNNIFLQPMTKDFLCESTQCEGLQVLVNKHLDERFLSKKALEEFGDGDHCGLGHKKYAAHVELADEIWRSNILQNWIINEKQIIGEVE